MKKKTQEQAEKDLVSKLRKGVIFKPFIYTCSTQNIELHCKEHGDFTQSIAVVLRSGGCQLCGKESAILSLTKSQSQVELELSLKLNPCVSFLPFVYKHKTQVIEFICTKHGQFNQRIDVAKRTGGCQQCGKEISDTTHNINFNEFKQRSVKLYKNKLTYYPEHYRGYRKETRINCGIHGDFYQTPYLHLKSLNGCPKCGDKVRIKPRVEFDAFLTRAIKIHGNKYTYDQDTFIGLKHIINITCNVHGVFQMTPNSILSGYGCVQCSLGGGFKPTKPAILYYLSIKETSLTKIGVTNLSITKRFSSSDLEKINVVKIWKYQKGSDAFKIEQFIINHYKLYKYKGNSILQSGNTEIFNTDILGLIASNP